MEKRLSLLPPPNLLALMAVIISCFVCIKSNGQIPTVLWSEDFENNAISGWSASQGVWEIGVPASGPGSAFSPSKCAATVLNGNYPPSQESALIRLSYFTVPTANENPRLRFWHWFSYSTADYGKVQVKISGTTEWIDISGNYINTGSGVWTSPSLDLSAFAGKSIQLAFVHHSEDPWPGGNVSSGWYIDDISVVFGPLILNNPEYWENGLGDWSADFGTWQVGQPSSGPGSSHSGQKCAATVLSGNYAGTVSSRLISPPVIIPSADLFPRLRFWHWYSFSTADYGVVQIKEIDSINWKDLSGHFINTSSSVWTYPLLNLNDFAGKKVQFAFNFHAEDPWPGGNISTGWYLDEFEIVTGPILCNNPETWESGIGNWSVDYGTWEVGVPTSGPSNAHSGLNCAGTVLGGNYAGTVDSRIVSPPITISSQPNPLLRFWHWFNFSTSDYGRVQIKEVGTSEWNDLSEKFTSNCGNVWTYPTFELTGYEGQQVQIAFQFHAEDPWPGGNISTGWYIDDILIDFYEDIRPEVTDHQSTLSIYPNPASQSATISFSTDGSRVVTIELFDQFARCIRKFEQKTQISGNIKMTWDGNDDQGQPCPEGIYVVRITHDSKQQQGKIIKR